MLFRNHSKGIYVEQMKIVAGFSELKDLLIRTHRIQKNKELIKLYFNAENNQLLMHDYDEHTKAIILISRLDKNEISNFSGHKARILVKYSLSFPNPALFLNEEFKLSGFFRI